MPGRWTAYRPYSVATCAAVAHRRPDSAIAAIRGSAIDEGPQCTGPRLVSDCLDLGEHRPGEPFRPPRVVAPVEHEHAGQRRTHQPSGRGELDSGTHAVRVHVGSAQPGRQTLGEPPLYPAGRHGDDLAG